MASYIQGYDEERFVSKINRNFICQICFNVMRDPVLCPRNQHCFCRSCITKHLENAKRCPTCNDELTEQTLTEPNRMVKDMLNELNVRCVYNTRGCPETPELQHLEQHEDTCGFTPAVCTNQGCGTTVNKRDLIHHESEVCEFRKLKCHSCEEMSKTLTTLEKRMANFEENMARKRAKVETIVAIETEIKNTQNNMERRITNVERNVVEAVHKLDNEVKEMRTSLVKSFEEMKDVLVEIKDENTRKVRNTPSGDRENIIVAGGWKKSSVEMFNWRQKTWAPLQPMPNQQWGATSFVYNSYVTIAGGWNWNDGNLDDMIRMNADQTPDLSTPWSECPVKLPVKLINHSSVVYNHQLIVTGGHDGNQDTTSDSIHAIQLVPPYTVKTLSRMLKPRREHCTEIFGDSLLIVGGTTTVNYKDNLSSVVLYDIKKNECKQLSPLLYEVSGMATVRWQDNIVVIGGVDKHGKALNTVIIYNVKTEQSHMLPRMRHKRNGCTAVVVGINIVVLGGLGENGEEKSVESFNFQRYSWEELPEMSEERWLATAVVV